VTPATARDSRLVGLLAGIALMAFDAFISYSSLDKPTADAACAMLESLGIRCWIAPRDVMPGREYGAAIVDAIHQSRVLVLVFSSHANQSPQVGREVERAVKPVDKVTLTIPEPRRIRDREHVKYVASQPCMVCGRMPCDAHHLRFAQPRALGRKVSDEFTVPLCRGHHSEVHRSGNEAAWWQKAGIDPTLMARALWLGNHPLRNAVAPSSAVST
jgi:hypothetical protein